MQEKSIIKQNILKYLDFIGLTPYKFYQQTGITRGVLTQNNGMSEENTTRFLDYYPNISPEWLLTGKGEMLKNREEVQNVVNEPGESYGPDYKDLYFDAKYTIEVQKELIESFRNELILIKELNTKSRAG